MQTPGVSINSLWPEWLSCLRAKAEEKALSVVIHHPPAVVYTNQSEGFPPRLWGMCLSLFWQASTPSTTQTVCSPSCTIVSTASQENWLMLSSRQQAKSTLTTMNTGFLETCASVGRKVFIMFKKANIELIKWWMLPTLLGGWRQPMGSKATETKKSSRVSLLQEFGWRILSTWQLMKLATSWGSCTPWTRKL